MKNPTWGALEENNEARMKIAVTVLRTVLHSWYRAEQSAGRFHSRIDAMTAKMTGTAGSPTLKRKAMEASALCNSSYTACKHIRYVGQKTLLLLEICGADEGFPCASLGRDNQADVILVETTHGYNGDP